jgi:hypothetical protein
MKEAVLLCHVVLPDVLPQAMGPTNYELKLPKL